MFVKCESNPEDLSRASSRSSTDYDRLEFDEYLREFSLPDDASDCSSHRGEEDAHSNNNDEQFEDRNESTVVEFRKPPAISITKEATTHKREKRKSLTLSRIPSPETVQVIRVDVITGYPVSSDNSLLSELTDNDRSNSRGSARSASPYHKEIHLHSSSTQTDNAGDAIGDRGSRCQHLLHCRSVNLSDRSYASSKIAT